MLLIMLFCSVSRDPLSIGGPPAKIRIVKDQNSRREKSELQFIEIKQGKCIRMSCFIHWCSSVQNWRPAWSMFSHSGYYVATELLYIWPTFLTPLSTSSMPVCFINLYKPACVHFLMLHWRSYSLNLSGPSTKSKFCHSAGILLAWKTQISAFICNAISLILRNCYTNLSQESLVATNEFNFRFSTV